MSNSENYKGFEGLKYTDITSLRVATLPFGIYFDLRLCTVFLPCFALRFDKLHLLSTERVWEQQHLESIIIIAAFKKTL